jgi:hypothetical protein
MSRYTIVIVLIFIAMHFGVSAAQPSGDGLDFTAGLYNLSQSVFEPETLMSMPSLGFERCVRGSDLLLFPPMEGYTCATTHAAVRDGALLWELSCTSGSGRAYRAEGRGDFGRGEISGVNRLYWHGEAEPFRIETIKGTRVGDCP